MASSCCIELSACFALAVIDLRGKRIRLLAHVRGRSASVDITGGLQLQEW